MRIEDNMEPKFILELDGYIRIGYVRMHRDLLLPEICTKTYLLLRPSVI